jgi:hypothetical protein
LDEGAGELENADIDIATLALEGRREKEVACTVLPGDVTNREEFQNFATSMP